jgi:predicted lipoprotein with Yx(FWY)xxD motif
LKAPRRSPKYLCAAAGGVAIGMATLVSAVAPAPASATVSKAEYVARVVTRAPFGKMLVTERGLSLYTTAAACTGSCLTIWPPLVLAAGKTMAKGVTGLGTVNVTIGSKHERQVTYHGKKLYRFYIDSGSSVNGNGVGGFKVAKAT